MLERVAEWLWSIRSVEWAVYATRPFAGPESVLAYLSHRVGIANSRLITCDERGVTFRWKDYRIRGPSATKPVRDENVRRARELLAAQSDQRAPSDAAPDATADTSSTPYVCPSCGAPMIVIETFERGQHPRAPPASGTL